jgi:hypothetical protein|tara:strand:+ start:2217 stop:2369 length:153 start_codon:yes stop_codon:yes gene_type:complete
MEEEKYLKILAWIIVVIIGIPVLVLIFIKAAFIIPLVLLSLAIYHLTKSN